MNSNQTTWTGVLQFIALLASELGSLFDGDPVTNPAYGLLVTSFLIMIGLIQARDNSKTSEEVGAR